MSLYNIFKFFGINMPREQPAIDDCVLFHSVGDIMPYDYMVKKHSNDIIKDSNVVNFMPIKKDSARVIVIKRASGKVSYGVARLYTSAISGKDYQSIMFDHDNDKITHWGVISKHSRDYFDSVDQRKIPNIFYMEDGFFGVKESMIED